MLGLNLRIEFQGQRLSGTQIELANEKNTGATQLSAQSFLDITYPTQDVLKAIEAVGPDKGRPVVVIGERGLGKSHLMATIFHAVNDPVATRAWLSSWAKTLNQPSMEKIELRQGLKVIGESLHRQRYKFLWDLLFEKHPHGSFIKGKWDGMGAAKTDIPSDKLVIEMLQHTPVLLLLDEFQTWYDGLTNTKQYPFRSWAFNFIQILSEIAQQHPELLVFVVSVRSGETDAYLQIHRVNPVQIDFKAAGSPERIQQDRRRMLLHRLFENRLQVTNFDIERIASNHISEFFRLHNTPASDRDRRRDDFYDCWPFAPHLLQLLEDQVLVATDAQETRDLIKILANLFKSLGSQSPVLTAADFKLDDDGSGIGALLDSVANQQHRNLREKAQRNLIAVKDAVPDHREKAPHLEQLIGALWLRSIAVGNMAGADRTTLQVDITGSKPIDDNAFQVEMATIIENSFNIHQQGGKFVFKEDENPQAKLMASARNDRLFSDGSDIRQLAKEVRYVVGGAEDVAKRFRIIPLTQSWVTHPWSDIDEPDRPDNWNEDLLTIVVLPESPDKLNPTLGRWLKDHLQRRRNTIRFLLPRSGFEKTFFDRDLLILARAVLKAQEWSTQSPDFRDLQRKFQSELRDNLKKRFDRFAVLHKWNFSDPSSCEFDVEQLREQGSKIPAAIEDTLLNDVFVPEDFEDLVLAAAADNASLGKLLRELQEPRAGGATCIPWLGEVIMKEKLLRLCAQGKLTFDVRGNEKLQLMPGESADAAWTRLRSRLSYTGRQLDEIQLLLPSAAPISGSASTPNLPEISPKDELFGKFGEAGSHGGVSEGGAAPIINRPSSGGHSPSIFDDQRPRTKRNLSNPPTSALNLIGKLEGWGVNAATPISEVTVQLSLETGAQLRDFLRKLPDGITYGLSFDTDES
jgi:Protein of unknown function (DUF499)